LRTVKLTAFFYQTFYSLKKIKEIYMITIPQILLLLLVFGLFAATFWACFVSTEGPLRIASLLARLRLLKVKYETDTPVDPQEERRVMEELQNDIKASYSKEVISENKELRALFLFNCGFINGKIRTPGTDNKTGWLQYGALMNDFNDRYFALRGNRDLQPQ
jgi:hypothetical protein